MQCKTTTSAQTADRKPFIFDLCVAALSFALYLLWSYHFRFQGTLADADMYRMLRGLLDGAYSGSGLASGLHYGKGFSFGYLLAMYRFADQETLRDPQRLIALINGLGFWSAAVGSVCFWAALWVLQGLRRATLAIVLFIFAPIQLEQGTSVTRALSPSRSSQPPRCCCFFPRVVFAPSSVRSWVRYSCCWRSPCAPTSCWRFPSSFWRGPILAPSIC
jgi:hypothetical protein